MGRIRYIGSKARVAKQILDYIGSPQNPDRFFDVFAGTGIVSHEAAIRGWRIRANDHLLSASIITTAQLLSHKDVPFRAFRGYKKAITDLNSSLNHIGFIYREYTPSGKSQSGHERRYFTCENGERIDGMRNRIKEWHDSGKITNNERVLLLADLLEATNTVANIAGTYGCFLRHWTQNSLRPILVSPRQLLSKPVDFEVSNLDVFTLHAEPNDIVYMDPPYTKRQYAAYYHVLETIVAGDAPEVGGVTGLRPWKLKSSPFCFKKNALESLLSLAAGIGANKIFISYNSEGHIALSDMETKLKEFGEVRIYELGDIGRYRPNQKATTKSTHVTEYLVEWNRPRPYKANDQLPLFGSINILETQA